MMESQGNEGMEPPLPISLSPYSPICLLGAIGGVNFDIIDGEIGSED